MQINKEFTNLKLDIYRQIFLAALQKEGCVTPAQAAELYPDLDSQVHLLFTFTNYDFGNSTTQQIWVKCVLKCYKSGRIDGAFIDGNRDGCTSGATAGCNTSHEAAGSNSRNSSHRKVREAYPRPMGCNFQVAIDLLDAKRPIFIVLP